MIVPQIGAQTYVRVLPYDLHKFPLELNGQSMSFVHVRLIGT